MFILSLIAPVSSTSLHRKNKSVCETKGVEGYLGPRAAAEFRGSYEGLLAVMDFGVSYETKDEMFN